MCGVDDDRYKLERQLLAIQCKLTDAEVKSETNQYIKRWMKDFRTVSYESDDILDTFQYEALRCQAHIGVSRTHKTEMNTFGLLKSVEPPQVPCRQTHSGLDEYAEIFGRDDDKEVVVKLLLDQQDNQRLRVLPIFGMGGLGKTTLAKMVYNDHRVQQHFHLSMWHCVSENFEACALVRSVIELATKVTCNLPDTIKMLRGRLQEVIGQKR
uniref:NB-ARC domain-containing protein n=1 Tax=Aegilops tauschii subsp. strangulata TaxID=200361 RepID=A0A453LCV7_AEGTS